MKLIIENWRGYLAENEKSQNIGAIGKFDGDANASLALVDLKALGDYLRSSKDINDFVSKIDKVSGFVAGEDLSTSSIGNVVVGFISATNNKYLMKADPLMGGSGGPCMNTLSVKTSIGPGYGEKLYNALLGLTYPSYIAADRTSVSVGAGKRWEKISNQTSDTTPDNSGDFIGKFDKTSGPKGKGEKSPNYPLGSTSPREDDCVVYDVDDYPALDKGFRDKSQVKYYNTLKDNLDNWFENEIETLFEDPGFFGKLFGNTPKNKAEKIKKKLLSIGKSKFLDYQLNPGKYVKKAKNI